MLKRNKQWNKSHKVEHRISPLPKNQNDFAQIRAMISGKSSHPRPEKGSKFSYNDPQDARDVYRSVQLSQTPPSISSHQVSFNRASFSRNDRNFFSRRGETSNVKLKLRGTRVIYNSVIFARCSNRTASAGVGEGGEGEEGGRTKGFQPRGLSSPGAPATGRNTRLFLDTRARARDVGRATTIGRQAGLRFSRGLNERNP